MNIWQYQQAVSQRLLQWSFFSIGLGLLMRFAGRFWKNMGNQFITWGAIDAAIAVAGQMAANNRIDNLENPGETEVLAQEARNLGRLLWLNFGLDFLYLLWGFTWAKRDNGDGVARGNGLGVLIQGFFLLVFDFFHARHVPK